MRIRIRLLALVMLLGGATSAIYGGPRPSPSAQNSAKKKTASLKSRRKRVAARPKGQKAPTPDRIKEIQSALQREGTYEGPPNGKWDDATVEALKKFQDKNGFSPTGKIDALSLHKLGLGSDTAGKGAPIPAVPASSSPTSKTAQ
jgi:peptidoglycan hydrolase-like protein with peptidoglycan-binding domain